MLIEALHIAINVLEWIGAFIIAGSAVESVATLIYSAGRRQLNSAIVSIRLHFAQRLVLALEFLIAADILKSVHTPTNEELVLLGAIIAMRTVLSLSIMYELRVSNPKHVSDTSELSPYGANEVASKRDNT